MLGATPALAARSLKSPKRPELPLPSGQPSPWFPPPLKGLIPARSTFSLGLGRPGNEAASWARAFPRLNRGFSADRIAKGCD